MIECYVFWYASILNKSLFLSFSGIEEFDNFASQPSIALVTDGNGYHGLVEEGDTLVNVTPAIRIEKTDGHELLCNILILKDGVRDDQSPFQVLNKTRFIAS